MSGAKRIRVLLADDHQLFRAGVRALLRTRSDIEIVGESTDGREALRAVAALHPDVVLMDIMMPNLNGLDAAARIARAFPRTRVLITSMNADEDSVRRALRAGAAGYLVKSADPEELELAIRAAARGARFLSPALSEPCAGAKPRAAAAERSALERLTPRQREVLQMISEGCTTKEVAARLNISVKTAECYRGELMRALEIHEVANLTRYAIRAGLVSLDS